MRKVIGYGTVSGELRDKTLPQQIFDLCGNGFELLGPPAIFKAENIVGPDGFLINSGVILVQALVKYEEVAE